eukprot:scaffold2549_cov108-Isochrysis_galbana.AAC.5
MFATASTWSRISASRGTTTTVRPGAASAASWKVLDLPPPVGIRRSTSRPERVASMAARWSGLSGAPPKASALIASTMHTGSARSGPAPRRAARPFSPPVTSFPT